MGRHDGDNRHFLPLYEFACKMYIEEIVAIVLLVKERVLRSQFAVYYVYSCLA